MADPCRSATPRWRDSILFLLSPDKDGKLLWDKTYGTASSDHARAVVQSPAGGFVFAGRTWAGNNGSADAWLVAIDQAGKQLWQSHLGTKGYEQARALAVDGVDYVVAGRSRTDANAKFDAYLARTDASGKLLWQRVFGGPADDELNALVVLKDGYLVAGRSASLGKGDQDIYVGRTDGTGKLLWQRRYGSAKHDQANAAVAVAGGGFAIAGYIGTANSAKDIFLLRLDEKGAVRWRQTWGEKGDDVAGLLAATADGGFLLGAKATKTVGETSDHWQIRTDAWGNETCAWAGLCLEVKTTACQDGKPCTVDSCSPQTGKCSFKPHSLACSDADTCTKVDLCELGACKSGPVANCNDGNDCTTDSCDKVLGCVSAAAKDATKCDDGSVCSQPDSCQAGKCVAGCDGG